MSLQCFDQKQPVSPAYSTIAPSSPRQHESSIAIDGHFEGSLTEKQVYHWNGKDTKGGQSRVPIDMIPDDALLEIFDFYMSGRELDGTLDAWYALVHVCRKWRNVVFGSPRRLNLRLLCKDRTPVKEMLDVWPPLPIAVKWFEYCDKDKDNTIATLEHQDRISRFQLILDVSSSKVFAAMQQPFPALTYLILSHSGSGHTTVVPASFLGGSAPHLEFLFLGSVPFPGLPKLLLSATHLVYLHLHETPVNEYILPEEMVTYLSVLTRLQVLKIQFKSPRSRPSRNPPPLSQARVFLPVLTYLKFYGFCEYLENLVARIDAPLLEELTATFRERSDIPQLTEFIRRTPKVEAHVEICGSRFEFFLRRWGASRRAGRARRVWCNSDGVIY